MYEDSVSRERVISSTPISELEELVNFALRPVHLQEFIGQRETIAKLEISLAAAHQRDEPLEHILLHGPPGLGKTTLAHIIANEMKSKLVSTSGPALTRPGDLLGILTSLKRGDVLFIDEIHRLGIAVEEFIYPAMEDYKVDFVIDKGAFAKTINIPLLRFTLVGATTRAGLLSAPLRNRFGIQYHIDFYPVEDIKEVIKRAVVRLTGSSEPIEDGVLDEIAKRSRGTPRIANRLLRRVRDYCQVKGTGKFTLNETIQAIELEGIDECGLDVLDRKFLRIIIENYHGGPVGIEAIAATLNEEVNTLEEMVEPFLLKAGFIERTRVGRKASSKSYKHLAVEPLRGQVTLLENR
jgi:Holliday junction DNA helicase RuvB